MTFLFLSFFKDNSFDVKITYIYVIYIEDFFTLHSFLHFH